jgi:hypothetical protein
MQLILDECPTNPTELECNTEFPLVTISNNGVQLPRTPYNIKQSIWQLCDEYASLVGEKAVQKLLQELMNAPSLN